VKGREALKEKRGVDFRLCTGGKKGSFKAGEVSASLDKGKKGTPEDPADSGRRGEDDYGRKGEGDIDEGKKGEKEKHAYFKRLSPSAHVHELCRKGGGGRV